MTYALWVKEAGEGCDYMVGCGEKLIVMGSNPPTDEEIRALLEDYGNDPDRFSKIRIVKIDREFSPQEIHSFYDRDEEEDDSEAEEREERRKQYEALKREFG